MKISFEPVARDELNDIFEWIAKDNPDAAYKLIARIEERSRGSRRRTSHTWDVRVLSRGRENWSNIRTLSSTEWMTGDKRLSSSRSCMVRVIAKAKKDSAPARAAESCTADCCQK